MREKIKTQLLEILSSIRELHRQCLEQDAQVFEIMQDCQQAAIAIGETLETVAPQNKDTVSLLEQYCEQIFLYVSQEAEAAGTMELLNSLVRKVEEEIKQLPVKYQVVFFPYKAEMWDSLESIWLACREDESCECLVIPIPYFTYDAGSRKLIYCYDGERFPEEVPVIPYQEYDIKTECPDVAYLHNPYDQVNLVTSVHPAFFSSELKKYVRKLVYVPYYVTTGYISQEHLQLPVYFHMDYMIVQSEYFKSGCKGMHYYDKILPLGSPKLDRVIRLCREKPKAPEEWQPILNGNQSLMLNTSLSCVLNHEEVYLKKLWNLFRLVKHQEGIVLVWRPHPLLESTLNAMRPQLLAMYHELKDYFQSESVGIFDSTSDISRTVALTDGYIGEEATSVVNLFGAAGKPLLILNNCITEQFSEEAKRKIRISDMCFTDGKWWIVSGLYNGLFSMKENWSEICFEDRIEGQPVWCGGYSFLKEINEKIYLSPGMAFDFAVYDGKVPEKEHKLSFPGFDGEKRLLNYMQMVHYEGKIFYLPGKGTGILEYSIETGKWVCHTDCIEALKEGIAPELYQCVPDVFDCVRSGNKLWITALYTNRLLCFDMEEGTFRIDAVGEPDWKYSGITLAGEDLWLAECQSGRVLRWNTQTKEVQSYDMPEGFQCRQQMSGNWLAHRAVLNMGDWVITIPAFANATVKVNKKNGEATICAEDFWKDSGLPSNDYHPRLHHGCCFVKQVDEKRIWMQRTSDDALAVLDVETEKYELVYPMLTEKSLEQMLEGQDGFERFNKDYYSFSRRESRIFSAEDFISDLCNGNLEKVKRRQLQELESFAANLDGTCGEKVHNYLMETLKQGE